jgi:hypothetical protein
MDQHAVAVFPGGRFYLTSEQDALTKIPLSSTYFIDLVRPLSTKKLIFSVAYKNTERNANILWFYASPPTTSAG